MKKLRITIILGLVLCLLFGYSVQASNAGGYYKVTMTAISSEDVAIYTVASKGNTSKGYMEGKTKMFYGVLPKVTKNVSYKGTTVIVNFDRVESKNIRYTLRESNKYQRYARITKYKVVTTFVSPNGQSGTSTVTYKYQHSGYQTYKLVSTTKL